MGANQSDLSEPQYSYDVVVSTSQDALNAEIGKLVQAGDWPGLNSPFSSCVTVDGTGKVEGFGSGQLEQYFGFDPFSVPAGTDQADERVQAMDAAGLLFAYCATIGLPAGSAPNTLWVTLNSGEAAQPDISVPVGFSINLSALTIIYLKRDAGGTLLVQTYQSASPPPCPATIALEPVVTETFATLPGDLQAQLAALVPNSTFVVFQLNLQPGTMAYPTVWAIPGLEPGAPETARLQASLGAKFWAMRGATPVTLGFAVLPQSNAGPNDVEFQISPNRDASGQLSGQPWLDTLDFLVSMQYMAPPAPFAWNWLEPAELSRGTGGVLALARNTIRYAALQPIQQVIASLCIKPYLSMTHDGQVFTTALSFSQDAQDATWNFPAVGQASPGPDGFVPLVNVAYAQSTYSSSTSEASLSSINGQITSQFNGTVGVKDNVLRSDFHIFLSYDFAWHILGINAAESSSNFLDARAVLDCTFAPDVNGRPAVTSAISITDNSQPADVSIWDVVVGLSAAPGIISEVATDQKAAMGQLLQAIEPSLSALLSYNSAWILPLGTSPPSYLDMDFSDGQDLVAHFALPDPD